MGCESPALSDLARTSARSSPRITLLTLWFPSLRWKGASERFKTAQRRVPLLPQTQSTLQLAVRGSPSVTRSENQSSLQYLLLILVDALPCQSLSLDWLPRSFGR